MQSLVALKTSIDVFRLTLRYLKKSTAPDASVSDLKKAWSHELASLLGLAINVEGQVSSSKPLILVGNHVSYLDIALLLKTVDDVCFVAKEEVSRWPLFGRGAIATDTIFVKRQCGKSRAAARNAIREGLAKSKRIALFPSGTTCLNEEKTWRKGAFEIAQEDDILVQPFRINYTPLRQAAYIDRDFFPFHLYQLAKHGNIAAHIEFHPPLKIKDGERERCFCQSWAQLKPTLDTSSIEVTTEVPI